MWILVLISSITYTPFSVRSDEKGIWSTEGENKRGYPVIMVRSVHDDVRHTEIQHQVGHSDIRQPFGSVSAVHRTFICNQTKRQTHQIFLHTLGTVVGISLCRAPSDNFFEHWSTAAGTRHLSGTSHCNTHWRCGGQWQEDTRARSAVPGASSCALAPFTEKNMSSEVALDSAF